MNDQAAASDPNTVLLQAILAELRAMPAAIAGAIAAGDRSRGAALSQADRAMLAALLPVIAGTIGTYVFSARELIAHAASPVNAGLRVELERAFGPLAPGTTRRLGRFLTRGAGFVASGLRVERIGDAREGALWLVARV